MSKIQLVCPFRDFIEATMEHYRGSNEMKDFSAKVIGDIDDVVRRAGPSVGEWVVSMANFSDANQWRWMTPDESQYPIRMKKYGGELADKLRAVLPNKELGDITAVYAYMRYLYLYDEEDEEEDDAIAFFECDADNETITIGGGRIVFILHTLEDTVDPTPTAGFDPIRISLQKSILEELYPAMNKQYHTQYY